MLTKSRSQVAVAVVCGAALVFVSCGGKKDTAGASAPKEKEKPKPVSVEASASPAKPKKGLKLTTYPNNKFTGPGETVGEAATLGFSCPDNPYKDKEVSLKYEGYLKVETDGTYTFALMSDDESTLKLGGTTVVSNLESTKTTEGLANLKAGYYKLELDYQNNVGPGCFSLDWTASPDGSGKRPISAEQLFRD